jgi:hypothetical protein
MERVGASVGGFGREGEEAGLREREVGAGFGVGGVAGGVGGDDEVIGVVAALEEEADEGLVVGGDRGGGGGGKLRAVARTRGGADEAEA